MSAHAKSVIELRGVSWAPRRDDPGAGSRLPLDLCIGTREVIWLEGPPGEGKEAAFRLLSLSETPVAGEVVLESASLQAVSAEDRAHLRARRLGFLSASPFLLPSFTAIENIAVPLLKIAAVSLEDARDRIARVLSFVGLTGKEETSADQLNTCEQARLAMARALAIDPIVLFVEDLEPVLPAADLAELFILIRRATDLFGLAVVALAHAGRTAQPGERIIRFAGGLVQCDSALLPTAVP